jgi:hypothetical protein
MPTHPPCTMCAMKKQYVWIRAVDVDEFDKKLSEKIDDSTLRMLMMTLDDRYFHSLDIMSPFPFKDAFDNDSDRAEFVRRHQVQLKTENGTPIYDGEKLVGILINELNISREVALEYEGVRRQYFNDAGLIDKNNVGNNIVHVKKP